MSGLPIFQAYRHDLIRNVWKHFVNSRTCSCQLMLMALEAIINVFSSKAVSTQNVGKEKKEKIQISCPKEANMEWV